MSSTFESGVPFLFLFERRADLLGPAHLRQLYQVVKGPVGTGMGGKEGEKDEGVEV